MLCLLVSQFIDIMYYVSCFFVFNLLQLATGKGRVRFMDFLRIILARELRLVQWLNFSGTYVQLQLRFKKNSIAIVTVVRIYKFLISGKLDYVKRVIFRLALTNASALIFQRCVNKILDNAAIHCCKKSKQKAIIAEFILLGQVVFNGVLDYRLCLRTSDVIIPRQTTLEQLTIMMIFEYVAVYVILKTRLIRNMVVRNK